MCGRFTTGGGKRDPKELDDRLQAAMSGIEAALGRFNVAPRQQVGTVERLDDGERHARLARWGLLPKWAKTSKDRMQPINARDDKLLTSKLWRPLLAKGAHRVLIPATGWYEWLRSEDRKEKPAPFHHTVDGGDWFTFAGLIDTTRVDDLDEPITTLAMITTTANGPAARIHDRMPAVLAGPAEEAAWLDPDLSADDVLELIRPLDDDRVTVTPASKLVNSVKNQGPELLVAE